YGLRSAPHGVTAELIDWANASGAPILALDLPSGVNATTGERPGASIRAAATVTLALPKTGFARADPGALWLAAIALPPAVFERAGIDGYRDPFGGRDRVRLDRTPRV